MTSSPATARVPAPADGLDRPRVVPTEVQGEPVHTPRKHKHASTPGAGSRIGGLDGLRAIAVTAVVIYHLGIEWLPGGFLGVDLFFVISGFLITTLLLTEVGVRGRIDFKGFYLRRARRLLPALVLMLIGTAIVVSTIATDVAEQFLRDLPGAALYVSNWWALGQEQSYFELIGRGNVLAHLWSLAVEEQFYLLWPVMLGGICWVANRRGMSRRRLVLVVALGGAVASTLWMSWLSVSRGMPIEADPTRVYFGTDTHAMSVLLGAALAAVWRPAHFRTVIPAGARTAVIGAGVVGLAMTAWLFVTVTEYTPWLYRGGFLLAAAVFALVIAAATHPGAPVGRLLDVAPLRWVGERSYGIYLWHWPIFLVTRPGVDIPWEGPLVDVGRVALTLGVAALSYRYVEVPIRHGAIGKAIASMRERARTVGPVDAVVPRRRVTIATLLVTTAVVAALVASFATLPKTEPVLAAYGEYGSTEAISDDASPTAAPSTKPSTKPSSKPSSTPSSKPSTKPTPKPSASSKPAGRPRPGREALDRRLRHRRHQLVRRLRHAVVRGRAPLDPAGREARRRDQQVAREHPGLRAREPRPRHAAADRRDAHGHGRPGVGGPARGHHRQARRPRPHRAGHLDGAVRVGEAQQPGDGRSRLAARQRRARRLAHLLHRQGRLVQGRPAPHREGQALLRQLREEGRALGLTPQAMARGSATSSTS